MRYSALPSAHANAYANDDSLIAVEKDFSPTSSPTPVDFTNESDRDEMVKENDNDSVLESDCICSN